MCMVFEMLGDNLLTLIKANKYRGTPAHIVRTLVRSVSGNEAKPQLLQVGRTPCVGFFCRSARAWIFYIPNAVSSTLTSSQRTCY